ncbi:glycoside hydrolase family 2 protein [Wenyingzhuangia aestuarii]|uniref:glycoside hydrolase family 2 protein n=1 Tax=Wenyingzhuangia aestuarii TaxID=1647582 RepID=UPI00143C7088|nr:glycoside hydrolase family 2 TIM barrel-domain containing protein [Wenyingzhuangia aestuarii]NJB83958.1 beta-galactosidase [Wenyingzhuangia aestuarii]
MYRKLKNVFKVTVLVSFLNLNFVYSQGLKTESRIDKIINDGWAFKKGDFLKAQNRDFDTSSWEIVNIPHNWGWEKAEKGDNKFYRGSGWYRKKIVINPKENKRYYIRFEAVGYKAEVYLNGKLVGNHSGGFGAFCFEITKYATNGNNILAVKASNKKDMSIAPLGGDFNVYGGIYRSVHLIEASDISFNLTDYASSGVKYLQTSVSKEKAVLDVIAWINNGTKQGLKFDHFPKELDQVIPEGLYDLEASVYDDRGKLVTSGKRQINLSPKLTVPFKLKLQIDNPHLWQGTIDPYLYKAVIAIKSQGKVIDELIHNIGLRSYKIDPKKGFFLNGKPYRIKGVSKHQDRKGKGWAVSNKDLEEDIALIMEMGANGLRCAHYQHSDYLMELCDKNGILVWSEIPQVGGIMNKEDFIKVSRDQLLELIRQQVNHTSVFAWGLFNEVHTSKEDPHRSFVDLENMASVEDPTRPTIAATSHYAAPEMNRIPDLLGWNRYPGWYDPIADLYNPNQWDKYVPTSQSGGFCFSEYGAGANIEHHEQNPLQPIPRSFWHPEEWQSIVHEAAWKRYSTTPYIWGSFVWNMFDFSAAKRNEGGQKGINDKGLVTFDRKIKKDAFFFYKSNWSKEPVLYITSKRHKIRNKAITPIKVYCNVAKEVKLKVNGKTIGTAKVDDYKTVIWKDIVLKKGNNKIEVSVKKNGKTIKDKTVWKFDPKSKSIKPEEKIKTRVKGDGGFGQ